MWCLLPSVVSMLGQCEQAAAPHQGFGPFAVDILDIRQPSHFLEVLLIVVDSVRSDAGTSNSPFQEHLQCKPHHSTIHILSTLGALFLSSDR